MTCAGLALALSALTSCSTSRMVRLGPAGARDSVTTAQRRMSVIGYETKDGTYHRFDGYLVARGDSLRFVVPARRARGLERWRPGRTECVHRDSVRLVRTRVTDYPKSVLLGAALTAFVMLVATGVALSAGGFTSI